MINSDLQQAVLEDRYVARQNGLPIERTWKDVTNRVVMAATIDDPPWAKAQIRDMIEGMYFVPGGRILAALGAPQKVTPYNCFVIPSPEDSREGIIHSLGQWVEVQSRGGGVGINMSSLRPRGSPVRGVNGVSSGPVSWMELFSTATYHVIQQGGSRRGAAMMLLDDHHPDIIEFIDAKRDTGRLQGANLSVAVSDDLMKAVMEDGSWDLHWDGVLVNRISARSLWNRIIDAAWASGEPGVVFLDRSNKESNSYYFEDLVATNPCAEKPMAAYGVCLLGAVNLGRHHQNGHVDISQIAQTAGAAVRFLDNIIDSAVYPLPESESHQKRVRQIGIGTMGLADLLDAVGVRYGSPEAVQITEDIFREIKDAAYLASVSIARERGSFAAFDRDKFLEGRFVRRLSPSVRAAIAEHGIRNCFLTSQAPTGTTGKLAGVQEGIEPYYAPTTYYTTRLGKVYHRTIKPVPTTAFASDLDPTEHLDMMAAAQKHIDSAVSKTVNAPNHQTRDGTDEVYREAYMKGLKSVAYYRDGSRGSQPQSANPPPVDEDLSCQSCDDTTEGIVGGCRI